MSDDSTSFTGTAIIVWFNDGKMKHRQCQTQEILETEIESLRKHTPPNRIFVLLINWDDDEMQTYTVEEMLS